MTVKNDLKENPIMIQFFILNFRKKSKILMMTYSMLTLLKTYFSFLFLIKESQFTADDSFKIPSPAWSIFPRNKFKFSPPGKE